MKTVIINNPEKVVPLYNVSDRKFYGTNLNLNANSRGYIRKIDYDKEGWAVFAYNGLERCNYYSSTVAPTIKGCIEAVND